VPIPPPPPKLKTLLFYLNPRVANPYRLYGICTSLENPRVQKLTLNYP
jgi:hypothetical protein